MFRLSSLMLFLSLCCDRSLHRPPPLPDRLPPATLWFCLLQGSPEEEPSTTTHLDTTCPTSPPSTSKDTPSRFESLCSFIILSHKSDGSKDSSQSCCNFNVSLSSPQASQMYQYMSTVNQSKYPRAKGIHYTHTHTHIY